MAPLQSTGWSIWYLGTSAPRSELMRSLDHAVPPGLHLVSLMLHAGSASPACSKTKRVSLVTHGQERGTESGSNREVLPKSLGVQSTILEMV